MDVRVGLQRKLSAKEFMLLNCGVGEDSWDSLWHQGNQTSQSYRKSVLNIHWKDWCWSWSSNTLATWLEELPLWKRPWCWKRLKAGERHDTGWDGQIASPTGWTFEQVLGVGDGQGSLTCCSPSVRHNWVTKLILLHNSLLVHIQDNREWTIKLQVQGWQT